MRHRGWAEYMDTITTAGASNPTVESLAIEFAPTGLP